MTDNVFNYALVFRAETAAARNDVAEMQKLAGSATTQTGHSTAAVKEHTSAVERDTAATKRAAEAARVLAESDRKARDAALKTAGVPRPANTPDRGQGGEQFGPHISEQVKDLRAQYVPLYAAQRTYQTELAKIDKAHKVGAVSADEQAAAQRRLRTAYDTQVAANGASNRLMVAGGKTMKLNAQQAQNLSYQLNDVFQTLMLGMPIQQIALQQGPQITQIYGGVGKTFSALKAALTPARIAMGATTGTVLTGALAWKGYLESVKEVGTAADGIGSSMAGTSTQMEAVAWAGASAAGIGIKAARSMEAQFLRTGQIGAENFEGLIGMSKDFAVTMGIEAGAAGAALSQMFADPAKAAQELSQKYGLIDAATARHVSTLTAQNRVSEAQAVLINKLPERLAKAEEATHGLARAWGSVKVNASNALDAVAGAIDGVLDGPTLADQLADVRTDLNRPTSEKSTWAARTQRSDWIQKEADLIARIREKEQSDAVQKLIERRKKTGVRALGIANQSPSVDTALKKEELANQIAGLEAGRDAPGLDDTQRTRIEQAIEAKTNALVGLGNQQIRLIELDRIDIQIQNERNPVMKAELEARRTRLKLVGEEISTEKMENEAARARIRVMGETIAAARSQAAEMTIEAEARSRLNALVSGGVITSEQANRMLEEELRLRPLIAAAARAEGKEKAELQAAIEQLRLGYGALETQRSRASVSDHLRGQDEVLEKLRLETAMLGMNANARAQILAQLQAERDIRDLGIASDGPDANQIRGRASQIARETAELEKLAEAWGKVASAAEGSIDSVVDDLLSGDISGAIEGIGAEITGLFADLAIKNPLKNALLGTDYGTLDDLGGLKGVWARLTGKAEAPGASSLGRGNMSTGSMTVTASNVVINGLLGAAGAAPVGGAANANGISATGGLAGGDNVQRQIWQFFKSKGLEPHQIAGIMGNVSAESGFDPLAKGDNGHAFGLFQHNDRRHNLFRHLGGQQNLGDVQGQLDFVWKELQSSEATSLARLRASTNVQEATGAFVGFERPRGYSVANPENAMHFDRRLGAAQSAMTKFSSATTSATENLGTFGNGMDVLGGALGQITGIGGSGTSSTGGSAWGDLIGGVLGAFGVKGFRVGGATGGTDPDKVAGLVHEREYVFDAASTARIGVGNLEALRKGNMAGFRRGGYASSIAMPTIGQNSNNEVSSGPVVTINNYTGQPVSQEESVSSGGKRQTSITIGEQGAAAIAQSGNPMDKQLRRTYGLKRAGPSR